ncbi:MAG: hypothetical protein J6D03_07000 [Clostridia bacterium]|nr:hypothetical protein [Clostridia bacterium]
MKRYKLKYKCSNKITNNFAKSTTNIPYTYLLDNEDLIETTLTYVDSVDKIRGWKMKKSDYKNVDKLYIDNKCKYNNSGECAVIEVEYGSYINTEPYHYLAATKEWSLTIVVENYWMFKDYDDNYVYLMLPNVDEMHKKELDVFGSSNELKEYIRKTQEKKWDESKDKITTPHNNQIEMSTKKLRIIKIINKPNVIDNLKVGDIIQGKINILTNIPNADLSFTNFGYNKEIVDVYINDEFVLTLSEKKFGNLFSKFIEVEIIDE